MYISVDFYERNHEKEMCRPKKDECGGSFPSMNDPCLKTTLATIRGKGETIGRSRPARRVAPPSTSKSKFQVLRAPALIYALRDSLDHPYKHLPRVGACFSFESRCAKPLILPATFHLTLSLPARQTPPRQSKRCKYCEVWILGTMTPLGVPGTPRRPASTRVRSARPKPDDGVGSSDKSKLVSSEPPRKKRRYIPGGPGGGGRYVDEDGTEIPVGGTGPGGYNYVGPRGRVGRENAAMGLIPQVFPRRDRSARTRTVLPRSQQPAMRFSSAAQAAAVVQSDGYKPREERAWEEFHPDLDIDAPLRAFSAHQVEGIVESRPVTPTMIPVSAGGSTNGTPNGIEGTYAKSEGIATPAGSLNGEIPTLSIPGTPGGPKRKPGRPPKNPTEFYAAKAAKVGAVLNIGTPKAPKIVIPVSNIGAKEKLTLPQPSYRKTDTLARFEDKALGLVRYVDKSMARVGYQESDNFDRPQDMLIKVSDGQMDDDLDPGPGYKGDGETIVSGSGNVGRVEYDMDEQDDKWLSNYNSERAGSNFEQITREIFEITITKIEKEWHALEKRIPKPNPKPPQTHRPRSSSAAAVNGEPQAGEEQDSKCAICDDGDCENTNAIVFCDGCDLAVHQECYGVPFIPEGQWLCRKCQLIGRGVPVCSLTPPNDI